MSWWYRVVLWVIGALFAAVLPFAAPLVERHESIDTSPLRVWDLLSKGDLYIVAITITIAGIVELCLSHQILTRTGRTGWALANVLLSAGVLVVATLMYAQGISSIHLAESSDKQLSEVFDVTTFAHDSAYFFIAGLALSSWCVSLTDESEEVS